MVCISWEVEQRAGVCENVSASWFDTCMRKVWRIRAEKKLPLDWKMATLNFGFSFGMRTRTLAWALCEIQIRKPKLKILWVRTLCRGFHSITTQNCGNPSQMLFGLKRWTEKENNKIAMRINIWWKTPRLRFQLRFADTSLNFAHSVPNPAAPLVQWMKAVMIFTAYSGVYLISTKW